jgi:hypothetical protein
MKAILHLYEMISGMKVDFHKSELIVINIDPSWLKEAVVAALICKVDRLLIKYLGRPIEADPRKMRT